MRGRPKAQLVLSESERDQLLTIAKRGKLAEASVLRARIVLACAEGLDNRTVAATFETAPRTVSKWRSRFIRYRVEGLRDAPRPGAPKRVTEAAIATILAGKLDIGAPARSTREMAREANTSQSTVVRIWRNVGVQGTDLDGRRHSSSPQAMGSPAVFSARNYNSMRDADASELTDDSSSSAQADLLLAFEMAPIGLLVARQRVVQSYNHAFCSMFGHTRETLVGESLEFLYPSRDEFQHIGERALVAMRNSGYYSDERIMRRLDGSLFWCHVSGRAIDCQDPFAVAVWAFEDISPARRVTKDLTMREREVAQLLVAGKSSKQIARELNISFRTVEAHRARLMRKYGVGTVSELIAHLIGRH